MSTTEAAKIPTEYCLRYFPKRYERACRYRSEKDRLLCIAAGVMLSKICREEDIVTNEWGKPMLPDTVFNLSHSGEYAILGIGTAGVDIEKIGKASFAVAKRMFLPEELVYMGDDDDRFYILWTLKEAVMKAVGKGFSLIPSSFSVMPLIQKNPLTIDGFTLYASTTTFCDYRISVCTPEPSPSISLKVFEEESEE